LFGTLSHAALLLDSDFIFIESGTPRFRFTESELAWSLEALLGLRLFECLLDLRLIFVSLDEVGDPGETGSRDSLLA
jgi:hypothetical protein